MKRQLLLTLLLGCVTLFARAQTPPASTSQLSPDQQAIIQLERDLITAYNTGDTKILERIIADDGARGTNKKSMLLYKKPYDADAFEVAGMKVDVWDNTAVATGTMTVSTKQQNEMSSRYYRFTDTFLKRQNSWQVVASSRAEVPVWQTREIKDNELTALTAMDCAEELAMRSLNGDKSGFIKFTNTSQQPITIHWINREGKREPLPTGKWILAPGTSFPMQTYLTHPFVVSDASGKCLGLYTAKQEPGLVVIK